jgi:hypothetical protein
MCCALGFPTSSLIPSSLQHCRIGYQGEPWMVVDTTAHRQKGTPIACFNNGLGKDLSFMCCALGFSNKFVDTIMIAAACLTATTLSLGRQPGGGSEALQAQNELVLVSESPSASRSRCPSQHMRTRLGLAESTTCHLLQLPLCHLAGSLVVAYKLSRHKMSWI